MMNLNQPVYSRGRQWAVTGYGIEALSGLYHIPWCNLEDEPSRQRLLTELQHHYWIHRDDLKAALAACRSRIGAKEPSH
jgi:hypothetical protein